MKIDFDPLDVPRNRFLVAASAWEKSRAGDADPLKFGIFKGDLRGLWFISGNPVRDLAALNEILTSGVLSLTQTSCSMMISLRFSTDSPC